MKTILLLDYEPECSGTIAEILHRLEYKVISAPDGASALSLIKEGTPVDLVITDYRLTGMDGLEFLSALKEIAPTIPSIMCTAYGSIETYFRALNLGVYDFMHKPVTANEVGRVVERVLERPRGLEYRNRTPRDA